MSAAASSALAQTAAPPPTYVFGIPVDFILFALTLIGVALFHHKTLQVALAGLGLPGLHRRLRRLDDLLRIVRGRSPVQHVSGGKSVGRWLRDGGPVAVAYVFGFFVMLAILGWTPDAPHKKRVDLPSIQVTMGNSE